MFICAAGDIHGAMNRLYDDVLAFEASLGVRFDYVLHVGDFGVWPDPDRIDKATRRHGGAGDFPVWFAANRAAPRPTVFIKGNHEDFVWLDEQLEAGRREILPGLTYLPSGDVIDIGEDRERGSASAASAAATVRPTMSVGLAIYRDGPSVTSPMTSANA